MQKKHRKEEQDCVEKVQVKLDDFNCVFYRMAIADCFVRQGNTLGLIICGYGKGYNLVSAREENYFAGLRGNGCCRATDEIYS